MRRRPAICSRCGKPHHPANNNTRRHFLARAVQLIAGAFVATQVIGCSEEPYAASPPETVVEPESLTGGPLFHPEDYNFDPADAAPAINRALIAAAPVRGTVMLGREHAEYVFRSHIWLDGSAGAVTLKGMTRAIKLSNGGGVGFDGRPTRLYMRRNAALQSLHVAPVAGAIGPQVPGIDSGADAADGRSDHWTVDHCEIEGFTGIGINFGNYSSHVTITNNRIHHNGDAGVQVNTQCNFCRVASNTVLHNARNGIDCNGNDNVIEDNTCNFNGTQAGTVDRNGILVGGVIGLPSNRNVIRNNRCARNNRCGIFVGGETMTGTSLIDNVANENRFSGIMVEALTAANRNEALIVTGNVLHRNGYHGYAENGNGQITYIRFENNVGEGNIPGFLLKY